MLRVKHILLLLILIMASNSYAGHEKGGIIIEYKSLAAVNNNPLEYQVTVYTIYEAGAVSPPSSITLNISSSCFTNSTQSLPKVTSLSTTFTGDYCTPGANISSSSLSVVFRGTVILPGVCSDFRFSVTGSFGRYFTSTNINDNFTSNAYFYVDLNNTQGPNSSVNTDVTQMIQGACVNNPLNLYSFTDSDGDSLYFSASVPQGINSGTVTGYGYKTGYSISNQVGSSSGFNIDPVTGVVSTTINSQGQYYLTIKCQEYRTDTATGSPMLVAENRYIMLVMGITTCNTAPFKVKHLSSAGSDTVPCGSQIIKVATSRKFAPSTISGNGSEFEVKDQGGVLIPLTGAQALSDTIIELQLSQPVSAGKTLTVVAKQGTDSDVIFSICGKEITAYDDTLTYYSAGSGVAVASFGYNSNLLTVNFNSSASTADSIYWNFGSGGGTSTVPNPSYNYPAQGQYTITMIAFSFCGSADTSIQTIWVCDSLVASFNYSAQGDTILFDGSASSGAQTYLWDFGDGNTGTGAMPSHYYSTKGQFIVKLTVVNPCGDTLTVLDTVETCLAPVPWWTYTITGTGGSGMTVDFDGSLSMNVSSFVWDFGDGNTNTTSLTPTHTYVTPSLNYRVVLTVTNDCGQSISYGYKLSEIGLEETDPLGLKVYPVPADVKLIIEIPERSVIQMVRVVNMAGVVVYSSNDQGNRDSDFEIATGLMSEGIYLLIVDTDNGAFLKKIQVRH